MGLRVFSQMLYDITILYLTRLFAVPDYGRGSLRVWLDPPFREVSSMRRIVAVALASSMFSAPLFAAGAPRAQAQPASLAGTASSSSGQTLANATVQLRNVTTGQLAGTTTSTASGSFSFGGLQAGTYTVEVVSATGQIVGTSAAISVGAGATVTGVAVSATAAAVAGGAAAGAAAAGGAAAGGGISTAVIITTVAAAAGVAGAVAVAKSGDSSPSR
jgi:hypothetical protein